MSWLQKVEKGISITTGDGRKYTPEYFITPKSTDFNIAEFNFPNVEGTLVKRGTVKGAKHNFVFVFQGENHLDVTFNFELSAKDNRPWIIEHPLYGNLRVHPTSLTYDSTGINITRVTGEFIETILDTFPQVSLNPKEFISIQSTNAIEECVVSTSNKLVADSKLQKILDKLTKSIYNINSAITKIQEEAGDYMNIFNNALAQIDTIQSNLDSAIRNIGNVVNFPSRFVASIKLKIEGFQESFLTLDEIFKLPESLNNKVTYEFFGTSIISSTVSTIAFSETTDFETTNDVINTIDAVLTMQNSFITKLDDLQNDTIGDEDAYIPNYDSLNEMNILVNFAVANLLDIATQSKQERSFYLEDDSNALLLTHRLYGLDQDDENLVKFMKQNNIILNEIIQIKKGRKIVYFV